MLYSNTYWSLAASSHQSEALMGECECLLSQWLLLAGWSWPSGSNFSVLVTWVILSPSRDDSVSFLQRCGRSCGILLVLTEFYLVLLPSVLGLAGAFSCAWCCSDGISFKSEERSGDWLPLAVFHIGLLYLVLCPVFIGTEGLKFFSLFRVLEYTCLSHAFLYLSHHHSGKFLLFSFSTFSCVFMCVRTHICLCMYLSSSMYVKTSLSRGGEGKDVNPSTMLAGMLILDHDLQEMTPHTEGRNGRKGHSEREWAHVEKSAPSWHILEILRHGQHSSRGKVYIRIIGLSMPSCSIVHTHNFSNEKEISIQKLYPKGQRLGELRWLFQAWKDYACWNRILAQPCMVLWFV